MTEEEYIRMRNLLDTVIEQQAKAEERQTKTDERMDKNAQAIASLLTLAEIHEQEIATLNKETAERFRQTDERFKQTDKRFKETDDRINALINVVERYITKG